MAIFTDDFSSSSGTALNSAPTAISGWTFVGGGAGAESYQSVAVTSLGGGVNCLRMNDTGWGGAMLMYPTSIGSLGAAVQTEILIKWRLNNTTSTTSEYGSVQFPICRATSNLSARHAVGFRNNSGTFNLQLWYFQGGDDWANTGGAQDVTSTFVAGDWWWTRLFVNTSNQWQWKSWKDGDSEPAYFISLTSNTSQTSGYLGWGAYDIRWAPIDVGYFSVGTAGDSPDEPGGGGGGSVLRSRLSLLGVGR